MKPFEGFRKSGTFGVAPGTEVQGDLILKGLQTTLDLFSKDFFNTRSLQDGCILGALHDRTKVSLIDCITTQGMGSGSRGDEHYHFASVFPHFVIFGNEHITPVDRKIAKVSFHVNDADKLFYDFDAFGQVIDAAIHCAARRHQGDHRAERLRWRCPDDFLLHGQARDLQGRDHPWDSFGRAPTLLTVPRAAWDQR